MPHPLLYEINTRCWLWELSEKHHTPITLASVPESEFAHWRRLGFTHIWLMGVWNGGPRTLAFSRRQLDLHERAATLLPDFSKDDIVGSPYAIAGYEASEALGGEAGLREFRKKLAANGIKLILDFIPNHTGLDHPWLKKTPELFVRSPVQRSETFRQHTPGGALWIAHGKDPHFPAWDDTAQLDVRNPATRAAVVEELQSVACRCDGVRCDMAMLALNDVFAKTWAQFPISFPDRPRSSEFWAEAISTIKAAHPDFLFLAEAYWDLETRLLNLGFDFAYDKRLTDHLLARRPAEVQRHLAALARGGGGSSPRHQESSPANGDEPSPTRPIGVLHAHPKKSLPARAHFLENHDEPRIASVLPLDEHRAAALLILGLPGMRLLHQGQLTGATLHASAHLRRFPPELPRPEIAALYEAFLTALRKAAVGHGQGELLEPIPAWTDNPTAENVIVVQWQYATTQFDLVAVNIAPHPSQCYVKLTIEGLVGSGWQMTNLLGTERYERNGTALRENGLYLNLPAHAAQLFQFTPS